MEAILRSPVGGPLKIPRPPLMGLVLAFGVAVLESLKDALGKVATRSIPVASLLVLYKLVGLLVVLPFALPHFAHLPWGRLLPILTLNALLNAAAFYLYLRAIALSPLSLSVPMLSFSPVFLLLTSRLILGEGVPLPGKLGVGLVALGSYVLNVGDARYGLLRPLLSLLREPGSRRMLLVAAIWSITANLDRIGVGLAKPIVWVALMSGAVALLLLPLALPLRLERGQLKFPVAMGAADGVSAALQMWAILLAPVPYVISIKRTSILLSSVLGLLLFGEGRVWERVMGASLMFIGAVLIVLLG